MEKKLKPLPIGIQFFNSMREGGYAYVDKTKEISRMIHTAKFIFLSRPRRFGKSLIASTLEHLFLANRHYFEGLWMENNWEWVARPVIRLDMNSLNFKSRPLAELLDDQMKAHAEKYGINLKGKDEAAKFSELIETLAERGENPVVIIDEYEKPVTDFFTEKQKRQKNIDTLKSFYGTLKSKEDLIHFCFITGVSKIGKISVMSDLNQLTDITTNRQFSTLTGLTEAELLETFGDHLRAIALSNNISLERLVEQVREMYNGYSYDGIPENKVYNPFSVLNFLVAGQFDNYWFMSGTPTILMKLLGKERIPSYEMDKFRTGSELMESGDINDLSLRALMFQTGYLTIHRIEYMDEYIPVYVLGYPNKEVRDSFERHILAQYSGSSAGNTFNNLASQFRLTLEENDLPLFFELLDDLLDSIPYGITVKKEAYFHSILHVALHLSGFVTFSEVQTRKGRMDTVLLTKDRVFIFEFKINASAEVALQQIKDTGYVQRFRREDRPCTLVGVNFDTAKKAVTAWLPEEATL